MTDAPVRKRPGVRRPTFIGGWPLAIVTALAIFLLAFAWMAWRVRMGQDPVLGQAAAKSAPRPAKKIKRIIVERRVIVTELPPLQAAQSTATSAPYASSGTSSGPQYEAPQTYSAPAPAPAPVPAPVSQGS